MKDIEKKISYNGKEYHIVFNLNVMEALQEEYGTVQKWGELTEGGENKEPNAKAVIFGIAQMINEGIDIENEKSDEKRAPITSAKAGRIITEIGFQKVAKTINKMVSEGVKTKENSKNVKATKNQAV